jgi:hypothetical protein
VSRAVSGAALGLLVSTTPALAQTVAPRLTIGVNVAAQTGDFPAESTFVAEVFQEPATIAITRRVKSGLILDALAGWRLTDRLGVAANLSHWTRADDATAQASIPHPIFFDQPRTFTGAVPALAHEETWLALLATFRHPLTPRIDLVAQAGPAVAFAIHEVPTTAEVTETGAGPDVRLTLVRQDKELWGYHVGADVQYRLTPRLGVGGFARFVAARGNIGGLVRLELGGFNAGGGVRLWF